MSHQEKQAVTYFIADLHLAENRPDITACFLSFLKNEAVNAETLYILGDLFEYWIGDDDNSLLTTTISQALSSLSQSGTKIFFIHGNRDFLLGEKYAKRSGMLLLPEVDKITVYNKGIVILHGDTLCIQDVDYQAFRKKSRSWWWQAIVKNLPLFIRRKIAENYRKKSAQATAHKSQDIMDVTESEVVRCLEQHQSALMIHGHTHRPNIHDISVNNTPAQRIVVGDWYEQGSYLIMTPDTTNLINLTLAPNT